MTLNKHQLKKRKDGAHFSCAIVDPYAEEQPIKKPKQVKKERRPNVHAVKDIAYAVPVKAEPVEDFLKCDYGDEEATDEARTNEEAFEELQNMVQAKYLLAGNGGTSNYVLFNECGDDYQSNESGSSEAEEEEESEEGEFIPGQAQILADDDEY